MRKVINPYAFVSMPAEPAKHEEARGTLTGKIQCTLYPRTPLFIPNTTNDKIFSGNNDEHKSYDFYSYENLSGKRDKKTYEPVIPGSSIRGEVRALYETLTASCFSTAGKELVLYRRMPDIGNMGILKCENGRYTLHEAKRYMACFKSCGKDSGIKKLDGVEVDLFSEDNFRNYAKDKSDTTVEGRHVWFRPSGRSYDDNRYMPETVAEIYTTPQQDMKDGYILFGEPFGDRKHHFSIAEINSEKPNPVSLGDESESQIAIEMLKRVLQLYTDSRINKNLAVRVNRHKGYEQYAKRLERVCNEGGCIPVFYKHFKYKDIVSGKDRDTVYLSPACITKEVYRNTILDILKKSGFSPCSDLEKACPACGLFGMVNEDGQAGGFQLSKRSGTIGNADQESLAGRVRFSDARLDYSGEIRDLYDGERTLKELSSPKTSSTEFYLSSPSACKVAEKKKVEKAVVAKPAVPPKRQGGKSLSMAELRDVFKLEAALPEEEEEAVLPQGNGGDMWNYDFAFNWTNERPPTRELIDDYFPQLKGRKYYWQHANFSWRDITVSENVRDMKNKRNNTIRPLKTCKRFSGPGNPDYRFGFTVYFEQLTENELKQLIAVLRLEENLFHALGHGKPFGMGSVQISVDSVKVRKLAVKDGAVQRELVDCAADSLPLTEVFGDKVFVKQLKTICTLHRFPEDIPITYPQKQGMVYKWFGQNRGRTIQKPTITETLPEIPTDAKALPDKITLEC